MKKTIILLFIVILSNTYSLSGNKDRVGTAGASYLLQNPFARSSGLGSVGGSFVTGYESTFLNISGLAQTRNIELVGSHVNLFSGADINFNTFGFAKSIGKGEFKNAFALGLSSIDYGDLIRTTESNPEGGLGEFSPKAIVINGAFAKQFTKTISGGLAFKVVNEGISDAKASGIAFDAGVKYETGDSVNPKKLKFGVALRNVGSPMVATGDGFALKTLNPSTDLISTTEVRTVRYEIPSSLYIDFSYDIFPSKYTTLTLGAAFLANSFSNDIYGAGMQYRVNSKYINLIGRFGYKVEKNFYNSDNRQTLKNQFSGGLSIEFQSKTNSFVSLDYSYESTIAIGPIHRIGFTVDIAPKNKVK